MPTYTLRGVNVEFPFDAYDCQLVYMEKVIQALQDKQNALLESPTGTGKTLCLLCATLAWRKSLGAFSNGTMERELKFVSSQTGFSLSQSRTTNLPTIVYTSRTHSQLRQVIQELKRTNYRPKMVVLGSREQLCIHDEVRLLRGRAQTNACHFLCRRHTKRFCSHYNHVADFIKKNPSLGDEPIDIEDLLNIGRSCGPCPYYVARELHKSVDILFAPYNYLIDQGNRKSLNLAWDNSILIFDEAHNLEGLCADAASFDLSSGLLSTCISEAKKCMDLSIARRQMGSSNDNTHKPDNYAILKALLLKLEKRISEVLIHSKELGFTMPGPYIYELLGDLNVTCETSSMLIGIIEEAILLLEEDSDVSGGGMPQKTKGSICRLESMSEMFQIIFRNGGTSHAKYYRVHVQEIETAATAIFSGKASRTLSWWCFNPGFAMEEFSTLHVGSIILTSGTLSPMESFAQELKLEFPIRLENPHVISANQIWAGIVPLGPSGYSFNSSYRSRDSVEYKQELGNAIVNFARIVPDGLLVFFPSYYLLEQCIGCWKISANSSNSATIWERICKHKQPVVEPRQSSLFSSSIEDYISKLNDISTSGAIFFAVCRGKVSEGLDFADRAGRAVVITGMPFATKSDPKVRLKRDYLDEQASHGARCKILTGEEWYSQQAYRAVNQAVGRVIRHSHDYGAIIFCDERFSSSNRISLISLWIQPHMKCYSNFGDVAFTLTQFFRSASIHGASKLKLLQNENGESESPKSLHSKISKVLNQSALEGMLHSSKLDLGSVFESEKFLQSEENKGIKESVLEDRSHSSKSNLVSGHASALQTGVTTDRSSLNKFFASLAPPANRVRSSDIVSSAEHQNGPTFRDIVAASCPSAACHGSNLSGFGKHVSVSTMSSCRQVDWSERKTSKEGRILPCSFKKAKTSIVVPAPTQCCKSSNEESKDTHESTPGPTVCSDQETKGSAFLVQVKEKLTPAEYRDFVGFMKALKSKEMKIGQVLQSIIRLFSAPERVPLLQRFKGYIPAKYHGLYEHYCKAIVRADLIPDDQLPAASDEAP